MASDANLIKGARDAYSGAVAEAQAGKGLDMMYNTAMGTMQQMQAETKQEIADQKAVNRDLTNKFHEDMEAYSSSAMNLSEQHFKEVEKAVEGLKMDFANCSFTDESCKREVMAKMQAQTQRMNQQKDLREGNAEAYKNGLLSASLTGPEKRIMGIYMNPNASEYTLSYDRDPAEGGQAIYTISNPDFDESQPESDTNKKTISYNESDITKLFDKRIDTEGKKANAEYGVQLSTDGQNGIAFDPAKVSAKYNDLITDDSIESFTHDDMGYGSFIANISEKGGPVDDALIAAAKDPNNSFNIPAKDGEDNWYDNIDDEDRKMMVNAITNSDTSKNPNYNPDLHKSLVKDYYQKMAKKQHDNGVEVKRQKDEAVAEQNRIKREKLKMEYDYKYASNKVVQDNRKILAESNVVNDIISLGTSATVEDFSQLDGKKRAGGKSGEKGLYIRENDDGVLAIFSGDPDVDPEGATQHSVLSDDPNERARELFNMYGLPNKYMKITKYDIDQYKNK